MDQSVNDVIGEMQAELNTAMKKILNKIDRIRLSDNFSYFDIQRLTELYIEHEKLLNSETKLFELKGRLTRL
jgi:hypothetical protein